MSRINMFRDAAIRAVFIILVLFLCGPMCRLHAQVTYGINGTVTDSTGAAIPNADVTVTDKSTGIVQHVVTGGGGAYTVILSNAGSYSVAVTVPGFKNSIQNNVTVEVGKFSSAPFTMYPGSTTETVQVTDHKIALNTEDPGIGTTMEDELVQAAPIEVSGGPRQIDAFVLQAPGTGSPSNVDAEGGAMNINGGITSLSNYYYNGVPVSDSNTSTYVEGSKVYPPYEMVSQFRVESSTFSAQYGLAQGIISYKTASGTNRFHGDVFDILRNSFFDSAGFFPSSYNSDGKPIPPTNHQNDWGFTGSGPVILPHLYHGKDRTFFLFSLDWYGQNQGQTAFGTVPTAAERTGDFSHYLNASGAQIPIYDPETGEPFPGNIIPESRFSPVSASLLQQIPEPNRAGNVYGQQQNVLPAVKSITQYAHVWGFTVDHNLTQSQNLHFTLWSSHTSFPSLGSNIVPEDNELQSGQSSKMAGTGYLLSYVNVLSPRLVMTAGLLKLDSDYHVQNALSGVSFAGVAGSNTFPGVSFTGQNASSSWGSALTETSTRQVDFSLVNNWLWTPGRHTFNIGGELRRTLQNTINCATCGGRLQFSYAETSTPNASDPNFGSDGSSFASFLLGSVDNVLREKSEEVRLRDLDLSPYIQDDYRVSNRLTINAGLRWDVMVPVNAVNDNLVFADFNAPNPAAGGLLGAATKYGTCAGCTGTHRANIHWGNFGPRLGFSYMVDPSTVIQGGFYRTFLTGGAYSFSASRVAQQYASLLAGSFNASSTGTSAAGFGSWDARPVPNPSLTAFTPSIGNNQLIRQLDPKKAGITPYSQSWNIDIQRQLPWNMFLMVAYIGNRDIHLPSSLNQPNQLPVADLKYGNLLGELVTSQDAVNAGIKIPYANFVNEFGSNATVEQALLPYPMFGGTDNHFDQAGSSFYNAAQFQIEKRFTSGFSYLSNVTIGRNQSNVDYGVTLQQNNPINTFNQKAEWSASLLNQKYAVKFVGTYALPFGPGKPFLHSTNRAVSELAGGWQVSAILDYYAGNPVGLSQNNVVLMATNANGDGVNRPNIVPGVARKTYSYNRTKNYFMGKTAVQPVQFTTNAFTPSPQYGLGNAARNYSSLTSPPLAMENFSAMKSFRITDGVQALLRVDYFNAFNRTQLQLPDNDISDSTFGMVTSQSSQISNRQGQATFRIQF